MIDGQKNLTLDNYAQTTLINLTLIPSVIPSYKVKVRASDEAPNLETLTWHRHNHVMQRGGLQLYINRDICQRMIDTTFK